MIRLSKYLADCGVCSRRKADELIAAGLVSVDGVRAKVGQSIEPAAARVDVRGSRVLTPAAHHLTLVVNKPRGSIATMSDERGRKTVAQLLPKGRRMFPVGRLDAESTGVLLCTTDGELARVLTHPSFGVEKVYRVRAAGDLTPQTKAALGATGARQNPDGTCTFTITLREGRNRQVRRMCANRGLRVLDLTRVSFGPVGLGRLEPGTTRALNADEVRALSALVKGQKRATVRQTE